MSDWTGVILAAGMGTRMKSSHPKVLHSVCSKPLISHVADVMRRAGAGRLLAVINPAMENLPELRDALGSGVEFAIQPEALGTAHALECAKDAVGSAERIVVGAGDMALVRPESIAALVEAAESEDSLVSVLTAEVDDPFGFGRIVRGSTGEIVAIVEEKEADDQQKLIHEMNTGMYSIATPWCWGVLDNLRVSTSGEKYLTDLVAEAAEFGRATTASVVDASEALGVNNRAQLAEVESVMRDRIRVEHMLAGVTMRDPQTTYIDVDVEIGRDTELLPGNHILSGTRIGERCEIGPNSTLKNCEIRDGARIISSYVEDATVGEGNSVGPYSRIRPGTELESGAYVGNFAEIKNSKIGSGSHVGHFSYVGDTQVGEDVNIGAGTVTANFDGQDKHQTIIGDRSKIGSDTVIVAPVTIGEDAYTGSGAVVNRDVPPGETVVGVPAKPIKDRRVDRGASDRKAQ